jgi:photosystem II stability/assembly factor-like uncharacterized protein
MKSGRVFIIGTFSILVILGLFIINTRSITERNLNYLRASEEEESGRSFHAAADYARLLKADLTTGVINPEYVKAAYQQLNNMSKSRAGLNLTWDFKGPDNVGGRTRTLIVDNQNPKILYAGGVAGGIYKSTNGGEFWVKKKYTAELGGLIINCGAQAINGDLYFGTGEQLFTRLANGNLSSGNMGGGIYKSTDRGETWSRLSSTNPDAETRWQNIQAIAVNPTDANTIYAATQSGLRESNDGGLTWTAYPGSSTQKYIDVKVSPDGKTLYAGTFEMAGCKVYRSKDHGPLTQVGSTVISQSTVRLMIAIAPSNPNYVYVSTASNGAGLVRWLLEGIYQSTDNGDTWTKIIEGGSEAEPFGSAGNPQGDYDHIIAVDPINHKRFFVGGVDFYIYNDPFWYKGASNVEFYDDKETVLNPYYIHADKHGIVFDTVSKPYKMYVVTDGGVSVSKDAQYQKYPTYKTININYTTSQFYALAGSKWGDITGGTQDNGTFRIETNSLTKKNGKEILGGDGFYTEISRYEPNMFFSETYYGELNRSKDRGVNQQSLKKGKIKDLNTFPFNTPLRIWESIVDSNYIDSTQEPPVMVDTMMEISKLFYAGQNEVWLNLDAHDFSKDADKWFKISNSNLALYPLCMEYTSDGNTLFIGGTDHQVGTTGYLYRITGIQKAQYIYDPVNAYDPTANGIKTELLSTWSGRTVTGIGISPGNDNNVVVTLGNYVSATQKHVYLSKNALADNPANVVFTSIHGNLPGMPVYDAAIHSLGSGTDTIIVTTELGVFTTIDGGTNWTETNTGMERVPTYMIRQVQVKPWHNGFYYYIATHGQGIFSTSFGTNLSLADKTNYLIPEMSVYPNPASNFTNANINLPKKSDITIQVFDLRGSIIQTYQFRQAKAGKNTYTLNTSTFKPGTYLVRATADGRTVTNKLMISK